MCLSNQTKIVLFCLSTYYYNSPGTPLTYDLAQTNYEDVVDLNCLVQDLWAQFIMCCGLPVLLYIFSYYPLNSLFRNATKYK